MKKLLRVRILFGLMLIIFAVAALSASFYLYMNKPQHITTPQSSQKLQELALEVYKKCSTTSYKPTCYEEQIPKLMDYISMEDAFKVTVNVQTEDPSYTYCHVLGHKLSANEVKKDPTNWQDVIGRCPSGVCSNGCIHGAFQEKFRQESLSNNQISNIKPQLMNVCEERPNWHPTGLEQGSCYHALGHMVMYMTNADIPESINLCKELTIKPQGRDFSQLCYDGVFMQIFQPLEPEDFALVAGKQPTKETVDNFCNQYTDPPRASCISESWPLVRSDLINDPKALVTLCSKESPNQQGRCYNGLFYVLTAQFDLNTDKIVPYCEGLNDPYKEQCFANSASRLIETDYRNIEKAVKLCQKVSTEDKDNKCYEELLRYSTFNFHPDSPEFYELCNDLPGEWKDKCLNQSASRN